MASSRSGGAAGLKLNSDRTTGSPGCPSAERHVRSIVTIGRDQSRKVSAGPCEPMPWTKTIPTVPGTGPAELVPVALATASAGGGAAERAVDGCAWREVIGMPSVPFAVDGVRVSGRDPPDDRLAVRVRPVAVGDPPPDHAGGRPTEQPAAEKVELGDAPRVRREEDLAERRELQGLGHDGLGASADVVHRQPH